MDQVECVVVGAGVVGLAVARALALAGREVLVLEAASGIGTGISSRNSEVIHAGLHGAADWLKVRLCVQGRSSAVRLLCRREASTHRRLREAAGGHQFFRAASVASLGATRCG